MKLSDLQEMIEELKAKYGEEWDPPLRAVYQPSYPLTGVIEGLATAREIAQQEDADDCGDCEGTGEVKKNDDPYATQCTNCQGTGRQPLADFKEEDDFIYLLVGAPGYQRLSNGREESPYGSRIAWEVAEHCRGGF